MTLLRSLNLLLLSISLCGACTRVTKEAQSPDQRYLARVTVSDPGAMSSGYTSVSLGPVGMRPELLRDVVFGTAGLYDVDIRWKNGVLEVACEDCQPRQGRR